MTDYIYSIYAVKFYIKDKKKFKRLPSAFIITALFFLNGCAHINYPGISTRDYENPVRISTESTYRDRMEILKKELSALDEDVDEDESRLIAKEAILFSFFLAKEFRIIRPAILHNILVNMRFKERGLCVHWTEDLLEHLRRLDLKSFQLHWGVAHHGETWRVEHSSVVITAKGQDFEDGIVLDPWRHSGNLYWSLVKKDRYPWRKFGPE
jgi:hypothetical protein